MTRAFVGLGSNLGDREATILRAHDVREHVEALTVAAAIA